METKLLMQALIIFSLVVVMGFASSPEAKTKYQKATLAGGCFWCMEKPFEQLQGVESVVSGYTGGRSTNPTYNDYGAGGHIEAVEVLFDPTQITYSKILDVFWKQVDPTDTGGQFADRGRSYTTGIFYHSQEQKEQAEESKKALAEANIYDKPVVTPIIAASTFYAAEDYHQDYYKRNPIRYKFYRAGSGRDTFLKNIWGDQKNAGKSSGKDFSAQKQKLTSLQYHVTQEEGTEPPFKNEYWDNKKAGIYVDIVSGEPLFSSLDKYKSGTGWPSFSKPLVEQNIVEKSDRKLFSVRTEVRSREADSHLGHVFDDGPQPTGLRYCLNSASLRFISVEQLAAEGYEQFLPLFNQ